jgi:hypothetical protein
MVAPDRRVLFFFQGSGVEGQFCVQIRGFLPKPRILGVDTRKIGSRYEENWERHEVSGWPYEFFSVSQRHWDSGAVKEKVDKINEQTQQRARSTLGNQDDFTELFAIYMRQVTP